MKIANWDDNLFWDDPNLRWGDPSYLLEPGDLGYLPPSVPPNNNNKNKKKKMKRNTYYPSRLGDQIIWLVNFCNKLPGHATALGLTNAQRDAALADACWLVYVLQSWLGAARAWGPATTAAATLAQTGDGTALMVLPVFAAPALPVGVVPVNTGALARLFTFIELLKDSGQVTEPIGLDLRIFGSEMVGPDLNTVKPDFTATITATHIFLDWNWGGNAAYLEQIEIQVDRGTGAGFVFLVQDSTPGYNDTAPRPATLTKWTYRAIYRVGDAQVGLWSDPVSVIVGG